MTDPRPVPFDVLSCGRPLLVLAPHPDDESLGCGALLAAAFAGPGAHVVCMTDGSRSHPGSAAYPPARLAACRAAELDAAVAELGGGPGDITRLGVPDARLPDCGTDYDRIAARLADLAARRGAGCVIATAATDPHCDHVATARIGARTARLAGLRCLFYPVWSRWAVPEFRRALGPHREYRFRTGARRERKRRAIDAHASQLGRLIDDAPDGFRCPPAFVSMFLDEDEMFFDCEAP